MKGGGKEGRLTAHNHIYFVLLELMVRNRDDNQEDIRSISDCTCLRH